MPGPTASTKIFAVSPWRRSKKRGRASRVSSQADRKNPREKSIAVRALVNSGTEPGSLLSSCLIVVGDCFQTRTPGKLMTFMSALGAVELATRQPHFVQDRKHIPGTTGALQA